MSTDADLLERSQILFEASRLLTQPVALPSSLDRVFSSLMHRYHLDACLIFEGERDLVCTFSAGISDALRGSLHVRSGEGVSGVALASGQPRILRAGTEDASQDPLWSMVHARHPVREALLLPLVAEERLAGLAAYFSRGDHAFQEGRLQTLAAFSDTLALALRHHRHVESLDAARRRLELENASMVAELQSSNQALVRKARELKTIYDVALATAAGTRVDDIVGEILTGAKALVDLGSAAFFRLAPDGRLVPVEPAFERGGGEAASLALKAEECPLIERAIGDAQPQILPLADDSVVLPASWAGLKIRSLLVMPLKHDNQVKGLFCAINKTSGLFSEEDVRLLSLLTGHVVDVLERVSLDETLRQRVHDLSVLQEMAARLPSPPVLADTVAAIARSTRPALPGADLLLVFVHHPDSEALAAVGGDWAPDLPVDLLSLTTGTSERVPIAEAFRQIRPSTYEQGVSGASWQEDALVRGFGLTQLLYWPLSVDQGCIGVMAFGSRQADGLGDDARRLAALIARQGAIVVERSRLFERLRAANQKLEQMNRLKNEFISMVSHELRTPLTTIKGFVSIVLNEETGPLNDQQRHFLETSDRAIDRLTLLVSDLLDISRMEAGQVKMQLRPAGLREIVARAMTSFAAAAKSQGLSLAAQIPESLPPVMVDPDRLLQVFENLLTNALKFTPRGGITISAMDKGDYVLVSVKDTGLGIPREEADRVFEKFYQVKTGGGWPSKGTGLGLAIVRSIIESHRGKIWVESDTGQGADFRFILPRARPDQPPEKAAT